MGGCHGRTSPQIAERETQLATRTKAGTGVGGDGVGERGRLRRDRVRASIAYPQSSSWQTYVPEIHRDKIPSLGNLERGVPAVWRASRRATTELSPAIHRRDRVEINCPSQNDRYSLATIDGAVAERPLNLAVAL